MFIRRFMERVVSLLRIYWNHEPVWSSPSPPLEGAGQRRPLGIWLLELLWSLVFGIWSFRRRAFESSDGATPFHSSLKSLPLE